MVGDAVWGVRFFQSDKVPIARLACGPALLPAWLTLFILGVPSGAAMIPYTIIKEANPTRSKEVPPARSIS
jgi:hypothetical protein